MRFCILRRNSRWQLKVAGKRFLFKVPSRLFIYPASQKFHRNRSISHRFRDKCAFAFYAEIQDGNQKWWESDFLKSRQYTLDTLGVENFDEIPLFRTVKEIEANLCFCIFCNKSKIKNGLHYWGEEIFLKNWQEYTFWITYGSKNFDEIALSCTVKEIEAN